MCASIITDKLPSFYLASRFPLLKYSVILLLTVSNTVSNVSEFGVRGSGVVLAWWQRGQQRGAGFPGVGQGKAGEKEKPPGNNKSDVSVNRKKGGMCV